MKSYNLFLKTSSQCVEIPFKDIISLDKFTSYYSDANELAEFLIRCLRLNVKVDYQTEIAVLVKNSPKNNGRYLPILYNADKVSMEELQEELLEEIGMYEGGNLVMEKLMKKDDLEVLRLEKCVGMDIRSIVNNLVVYTRGNSNGRNR